MVDVGEKQVTRREATARGAVRMRTETLQAILAGQVPKGDVIAVARVGAIMAAKRTPELVPLCHPLPLDSVEVHFAQGEDSALLEIEATVRASARTGVEMEALAAVVAAGLAIYDMCKAIDRGMTLERVRLVAKSGGRSGEYRREGEREWPVKL